MMRISREEKKRRITMFLLIYASSLCQAISIDFYISMWLTLSSTTNYDDDDDNDEDESTESAG